MTLHLHKIDDPGTYMQDCSIPLDVLAGWDIAPGDADDARVCGAHRWQSLYLGFSNGDFYGTAMYENEYRGEFFVSSFWRAGRI